MNPNAEHLARLLCADLQANTRRFKWQRVSDVAARMGISLEQADAAAAFAAKRDWLDYEMHEVLLTEKGRSIELPPLVPRRVLTDRRKPSQ